MHDTPIDVPQPLVAYTNYINNNKNIKQHKSAYNTNQHKHQSTKYKLI